MNLRPRERQEPDINLTPLIDVVFLLLIFFMVSTTFRKETDLTIDLPEASQQPAVAEKQELTVSVDAQGHFFVNERALPDDRLESLKNALVEAVGDKRDLPFVIRADGRTQHQAVVKVMDAAGQLGFRRLAIVTIQPSSGQSGSGMDR